MGHEFVDYGKQIVEMVSGMKNQDFLFKIYHYARVKFLKEKAAQEECSPDAEGKSGIDCESPKGIEEFYREKMIEMVGKIYDVESLKMAYGFVKSCTGKKDNEQRTAEDRKSIMNR